MDNEILVRVGSLLIGMGFGNILTAFFVAKMFNASRPTEFGSGNPGTANVGAVLGKKAGIMVLAGDLLKSILAFLLVIAFFGNNIKIAILYCGLGLTIGHDFPLWNKFKGGKGVAISVPFLLFYDFQFGAIALITALVILIFMQNLIVPPLVFMLLMVVFNFIQGQYEAVSIFFIATLIMAFQYRFDLKLLINGRAKRVDILKSLKKLRN